MNWTIVIAIPSAAVLSLAYGAYEVWGIVQVSAEQRSPFYAARLHRWKEGIPDTVSDDLKSIPFK